MTKPATDRMRAALHREPAPGAEQPATKPVAPRVKPIRTTLDLEPADHKAAKMLTLEVDAPSLVALIRALLQCAREDPELADRVRAKIRALDQQ
jgi:hypothetical protein